MTASRSYGDHVAILAGPIIADEVVVNSSIDMYGFAVISDVIPGMPGNATVYAQPKKPELFSG